MAWTDEETEASELAQGHMSTQRRMEPTVHCSQKQKPLGNTTSEQTINRKEGFGCKAKGAYRDLYISRDNTHPKLLTAKPMFLA